MGCFAPDQPPQPNYGNITRDTLQAQVDLAPQQYAAEATYQPKYTDLALQNLNTVINGTDNTPGLPQLQAQANSAQRAADIADVAKYGQAAHAAIMGANPESATLLAKLNAQANAGLDAGSGLTPDEATQMQQASRAASAARGMSGGNQALADELLRQFNLGQTLLRQRQQFAQSVVGTNQAVEGDPFLQILGRAGVNPAVAQGVVNNAGPSLFNPQAALGLAESNYATKSQLAAATPTTFENIVAGMNATGNLLKGAAAAGAA